MGCLSFVDKQKNKPMKKVYDYVFVTHLPAFYKVNLYQEIAKSCRVFVIFIANTSSIRTADFTQTPAFEYCVLNSTCFEKRNIVSSSLRMFSQLRKLQFNKIVVGGWDLPEFWLAVFSGTKKKNALALESSILESPTQGWRSKIKKLFLSRISTVFASGDPHQQLLKKLGYEGSIRKTLGVGIFHYASQGSQHAQNLLGKFLYVGRLAPEKNLALLCQVFQQLPEYQLTIIGQGPEEAHLQSFSGKNIEFKGHVPNKELSMWYQNHDIFILPSLKEPWGLVVEEALFYGLPVIASQHVGCAKDLIESWGVGVLFEPHCAQSLKTAITRMMEHYPSIKNKLKNIDFHQRDAYQIQQYLEMIG